MSTKKSKAKAKHDPEVPAKWRNRIVGHAVVDPSDLLANPKNYRIHPKNQQQAMNAVLTEVGWVQAAIVNKRTGFVLDGHMRAAIAISRGEKIPITYVDLDQSEENLILAALDPLGSLAVADSDKFTELFQSLSVSDEALAATLSSFQGDAQKTQLKDDEGGESASGGERQLGDKSTQIKLVLYAEDIAVFEAAIQATGERNRGKALIEICRAYLGQHKEGQLDVRSEVALEAWQPA